MIDLKTAAVEIFGLDGRFTTHYGAAAVRAEKAATAPPPGNDGTETTAPIQGAAEDRQDEREAVKPEVAPAAAMIGDSAADPQAVPAPAPGPIPADDVLNEATDDGLVMLMVAHDTGPAISREHAIELLGARRDGVTTEAVTEPVAEPVMAAEPEPICVDDRGHPVG